MAQFLSRRWRRQPQGVVLVDWSNPLARGLDHVILINNAGAQNPAKPRFRPVQSSTFTLGGGSEGFGAACNGTAGGISLVNTGGAGYAHFSFAAAGFNHVGTAFTYPAGTIVFACGSHRVYKPDYNNWNVLSYTATSSNFEYPGDSRPAVDISGLLQKRITMGVTFGPTGNNKFYVNGSLKDSDPRAVTAGLRNLGFHLSINSRTGLTLPLAAAWARPLSDSEFLAFHENPWQLFAPQKSMTVFLSNTFSYSRPIADLSNSGWVRVP